MLILDFKKGPEVGWAVVWPPKMPQLDLQVVEPVLHPETQSEIVGKYEQVTNGLLDKLAEAGADELDVIDTRTRIRFRCVIDNESYQQVGDSPLQPFLSKAL